MRFVSMTLPPNRAMRSGKTYGATLKLMCPVPRMDTTSAQARLADHLVTDCDVDSEVCSAAYARQRLQH